MAKSKIVSQEANKQTLMQLQLQYSISAKQKNKIWLKIIEAAQQDATDAYGTV